MKFKFSAMVFLVVFAFAFQAKSQTSQPASGSTGSIPVISVGNQVKPNKSDEEKTEKRVKQPAKKSVERAPRVERTPRAEKIETIPLELKQTIYSRKSQVGNEVTFIVSENVPGRGTPLLARGTPVIGKISVLEKPSKKNPGKLTVVFDHILTPSGGSMPFSANLEMTSNGSYGKEVFMPAGYKQSVTPSSKVKFAGVRKQKTKPVKGLLTSKAELPDIVLKVNDGKLPSQVEVYIEPPTGMKVSDLKDDSLKLIRVNDFALLQPVSADPGNAKVGDHNKNNVQDLKFLFNGWELPKYLPEGSSAVVFSAMTKDGKVVEAVGRAKVEIR